MSRALFALVCSTSLMGCIIVREPSYSEPPNTPPVVLEDPTGRTPFHLVVDVDLSVGGPSSDGGVGTQIEFSVQIFDPDIDQPLVGVVLRDYQPGDEQTNRPIQNQIDIPPTGDRAVLRPLTFWVNRPGLMSGCHTIELHVSGEFRDIVLNPVPAEDEPEGQPADLGRAIWWLRVVDDEDDRVFMDECPR